jgi:glutathione reductase (NADPH)
MHTIGGTCVNEGCVPKKMTWYAADLFSLFSYAKDYALQNKPSPIHFKKFVLARDKYLKSLNKKYHQRLHKDNITYLPGKASFVDKHTLNINHSLYSADHIIIATGCAPNMPAIEGADLAIDSNGFFALKSLPKKMAIIGGGYIAMELSAILQQLGVDVYMLIRGSKPLNDFDPMITKALLATLKIKNIKLLSDCEVEKITRAPNKKLTLHLNKNKKIPKMDCALFAIGRHPCTMDLNLPAAGVKLNKDKYIAANKGEATNVPHIYAIGDITGKKLQTPVAVAAGRKLAARVFGKVKNSFLDYSNIPTVIFTHPPAGTVGLTEQQARDKYSSNQLAIYETRFYSLFYALSKTKIYSYIKLITLKKTGKIIGLHVIDKHADEIIVGFAVAMKMGATKADFDNTVGVHPTSAEEIVTLKKPLHKRARN